MNLGLFATGLQPLLLWCESCDLPVLCRFRVFGAAWQNSGCSQCAIGIVAATEGHLEGAEILILKKCSIETFVTFLTDPSLVLYPWVGAHHWLQLPGAERSETPAGLTSCF